jgi:hypothetical protein
LNYHLDPVLLSSRLYSQCVTSALNNVRLGLIDSDPEFVFD